MDNATTVLYCRRKFMDGPLFDAASVPLSFIPLLMIVYREKFWNYLSWPLSLLIFVCIFVLMLILIRLRIKRYKPPGPIATVENDALTLHGLETPLGSFAPLTLSFSSMKELTIAGHPPQSLIFTDDKGDEQVCLLAELCERKEQARLVTFLTEEFNRRNLIISECK